MSDEKKYDCQRYGWDKPCIELSGERCALYGKPECLNVKGKVEAKTLCPKCGCADIVCDACDTPIDVAGRNRLESELAAAKAEMERYKQLHEAELGVCERHCDVVAAKDAEIERLKAAWESSVQQALNNGSAANDMRAVLSDAAESLRWMTQEFEYRNRHIEADSDPNNELTGVAPKRSPELQKAVETLEKIDWLLKS